MSGYRRLKEFFHSRAAGGIALAFSGGVDSLLLLEVLRLLRQEEPFTLAAMNDALRGCGIPAVVEETETKQVVAVSFPGVVGVPEDFARRKERVEAILPCHLQVEYRFAETTGEGL